jgi:hypothetical protein
MNTTTVTSLSTPIAAPSGTFSSNKDATHEDAMRQDATHEAGESAPRDGEENAGRTPTAP